ncbi:carbohydrate ABC transporter permease [Paenibacillus alkalitolerans]|uniref:carbohydrate ABC transporter permease n=1 Tax=Paenibacillus alkalitolerans TaxID=2799335 RepID=UPI001F1FAB85|nr:sugar ABC transporter permease [Paenibacillus alkalitolerans]
MGTQSETLHKKGGPVRIGMKAWPYLFMAPFLLLYLAFQIYPILYSFVISFTSWDGIGEKQFIGLQNYVHVFSKDIFFWKSVGNTLLIMLMSTPATIVFGLLLAVFLFNLPRFKSFFQTVTFIPYITTPVAIGLIFALLFDWSAGVVNTALIRTGLLQEGINWLGEPLNARLVTSLMIIWKYTGYHMAIYLAGMSAIPSELYEAAKVDGSSPANTFFKITLPLLAPITMFLILTDLIGGFKMFDEPQLLFAGDGANMSVGGPDRSVLTVVWHFYDVTFATSRFGYGSAVAFSLFLIIMAFSAVSYKLMKKED